MEFIGNLVGASKDVLNGGYVLTFNTPELPELPDKETILRVDAKKYRQRRSLDANAYAWMLMSKIADLTHRSKEEVYVDALKNYGQHAFLFRVEHNTKVALDGVYVKYLEYDGTHDIYEAFRGSSTYDTKEMSDFIEGIVQDAKELGIDTVPRVELEKIKEKWHI